MATCLEKLCKANRWRLKDGQLASTEVAGWNGVFMVPLEGEIWQVILADGMGWRHLSVTNAQRRQLPSWNIMCRLKDLFYDDEAWVVQFHPAKDDHINVHPYVLHLWEPLNETLPKPLYVMV